MRRPAAPTPDRTFTTSAFGLAAHQAASTVPRVGTSSLALVAGREAGVAEFGALRERNQAVPVVLAQPDHLRPAVEAAQHARDAVAVSLPPVVHALVVVPVHAGAVQREDRLLDRHINPLCRAGPTQVVAGRQDGDRPVPTGIEVGDVTAELHRRAIGELLPAPSAGQRRPFAGSVEHGQMVARCSAIGPVAPYGRMATTTGRRDLTMWSTRDGSRSDDRVRRGGEVRELRVRRPRPRAACRRSSRRTRADAVAPWLVESTRVAVGRFRHDHLGAEVGEDPAAERGSRSPRRPPAPASLQGASPSTTRWVRPYAGSLRAARRGEPYSVVPAQTRVSSYLPKGASVTNNVFDGVRVVELAQWVFVPVAGALLADWGADVIRIEPPEGDPVPRAGHPGHRHRQRRGQPVDGAGQPGQALGRARPAHRARAGRAAPAARDGRRVPHQPAARGAAHARASTPRR